MIWDIQLRPHDISLTNATNKTLIELSTSSNAIERIFVARVVVIALVAAKIFDAAAHLTAAGALIIRLLFGVRPSEARGAKGEATIGAAVVELGRHLVRAGAHGVTLPMTFIGGLVNTRNALLAQTTFGLGARTFKQVKVTVDPALEPIPVVPRLPEPLSEAESQGIEVEQTTVEEDIPPQPPKEQTEAAAPERENTEDVRAEDAPAPEPVEEDTPPSPSPMPEKTEEVNSEETASPKAEEKVEEVSEQIPKDVQEEKVDTDKGETIPNEEEASTDESVPPPSSLSSKPRVFKRPEFGLKKAASIANFDLTKLKKVTKEEQSRQPEPKSSGSENLEDLMKREMFKRRNSLEQSQASDPEVKSLLTSIISGENVWGNEFDNLLNMLEPENPANADEASKKLKVLENELATLVDVLREKEVNQALKQQRILDFLPEEVPNEGTVAYEVYQRLLIFAQNRQFQRGDGTFTRPSF